MVRPLIITVSKQSTATKSDWKVSIFRSAITAGAYVKTLGLRNYSAHKTGEAFGTAWWNDTQTMCRCVPSYANRPYYVRNIGSTYIAPCKESLVGILVAIGDMSLDLHNCCPRIMRNGANIDLVDMVPYIEDYCMISNRKIAEADIGSPYNVSLKFLPGSIKSNNKLYGSNVIMHGKRHITEPQDVRMFMPRPIRGSVMLRKFNSNDKI